MRTLITGAAGFIGSHLADALLAQGHEVIGVDNFLTGFKRNVAHLAQNKSFKLIEADVCKPLSIDGAIDRIFHLASPASPKAYEQHRVATMMVNSIGAANLLDLAQSKKARFLQVSTSEIYGETNTPIQRENEWGTVNTLGLRSVYEEAKRFAESITMAYHREREIDTRIVRIFNTYGPRLAPNDGRVVSTFVNQVLRNEPITIYGDGTQTRTLCHVSDTVRGLIATMESDFHEPINIGNPTSVTMIELARLIVSLVPESSSKITFMPGLPYDPQVRKPDISRAKQILGWSPKISPAEGLPAVVQYYRELTDKN